MNDPSRFDRIREDKGQILVIEDDADVRRLLDMRLTNSGYSVITAENGREGLRKALATLPDLIILDLWLPDLAGEEVCKAIREHRDKIASAIPIIMLTAKRSEADRIVGIVIGANVYMQKPFDPDQLMEHVRRYAA